MNYPLMYHSCATEENYAYIHIIICTFIRLQRSRTQQGKTSILALSVYFFLEYFVCKNRFIIELKLLLNLFIYILRYETLRSILI